jgi:hypothetical protein
VSAGRHPTVTVRDPAGRKVEIDADMAPLITACWDAGVETSECCQEAAPGMARIGFLGLADMELFFDLVSGLGDDERDLEFGWKWDLWVDGGLHGTAHLPRTHIQWAADRVAKFAPELETEATR